VASGGRGRQRMTASGHTPLKDASAADCCAAVLPHGLARTRVALERPDVQRARLGDLAVDGRRGRGAPRAGNGRGGPRAADGRAGARDGCGVVAQRARPRVLVGTVHQRRVVGVGGRRRDALGAGGRHRRKDPVAVALAAVDAAAAGVTVAHVGAGAGVALRRVVGAILAARARVGVGAGQVVPVLQVMGVEGAAVTRSWCKRGASGQPPA